ncbi:MAG: tetraacyldisaccharide 4'-kinase [Methylicorpusculum sp.]|nr:tetraacyldisaccharide 4'-kinase [Methylicorpusculum sp.]
MNLKRIGASVLDFIWYKDDLFGLIMMPLGFIYRDIARFRRFLYRIGLLKTHKLSVPVVIVGNLTVGGTGKTPLIIWMAQVLQQNGYRPGIISRGYGGQSEAWPQMVDLNSDPRRVGDEPVLLARHSGCPVAVGPDRVATARMLLENSACTVILSDDGLQHYALARTIEIVVIDGERRFGNGYCLPAGPLRESQDRLSEVDLVVVNGVKSDETHFDMRVVGDDAVNLVSGAQVPLTDFTSAPCYAVAGIGNPARFFDMLANKGVTPICLKFPDHYQYSAKDLPNDGNPVLMTEKDAVKCQSFAKDNYWFVPVAANLEPDFAKRFLHLLGEKHHG